MEDIVKWDDSRDEIMDILEMVEDKETSQIPIMCPICNTTNAHIYMHRWENNRGTIWTWCSNCKSCAHGSRMCLPDWWVNDGFIDVSELTSHPIILESQVILIDKHLRKLLREREL